ncbi:MAG: hypothetical protein APF76_07515 [Desulfitibacter sp. BRH_c19]|nr:MAG: hypothetical protein APF76_07515 [Desulfitibacter sp. BRH_c19]
MKKIKVLLICGCLLLIAIYSLSNFDWYYYVWDSKYYEKVQDAYLMQFPQAREVASQNNHLITITIKSPDFYSLPYAKIYVNEYEISDLRDGQITLIVDHGDKIFVDTSFYERELDLEVVATSGSIVYPVAGERFTLLPQNNLLGEIELNSTR